MRKDVKEFLITAGIALFLAAFVILVTRSFSVAGSWGWIMAT